MNRQEFLERLRILLGDLSEEEREEAVQYYEDYFADAGPEMEEQIIKELGSPEKVALMIREGLRGEDAGDAYAENGFFRAGTTTERCRLTIRQAAVTREKRSRTADTETGSRRGGPGPAGH